MQLLAKGRDDDVRLCDIGDIGRCWLGERRSDAWTKASLSIPSADEMHSRKRETSLKSSRRKADTLYSYVTIASFSDVFFSFVVFFFFSCKISAPSPLLLEPTCQ